jgi:hypothetical protein
VPIFIPSFPRRGFLHKAGLASQPLQLVPVHSGLCGREQPVQMGRSKPLEEYKLQGPSRLLNAFEKV